MQILQPAIQGFKFGCDPELFVVNGDGVAVSAEGLIPGTKAEPYKVKYGAVQVDGMAAEFNIDPVENFEDFDRNISSVMKTLKSMLPKGYSLASVPYMDFSEEEWEKAPDIAKVLGCTPDFDAWTGSVNPPPEDLANPRRRTASGHLHIGWTDDESLGDEGHINNCRDLVKQFDWFLGGWSLQKDTSPHRRVLYGKAGACRYKPYGVEYRVLSNFWVRSRDLRLQVWNRMQAGIRGMNKSFFPETAGAHNDLLINMINKSERSTSLESYYSFPLRGI